MTYKSYGIVVGGHKDDPGPKGTAKVVVPTRHSSNFEPDSMPFITCVQSPNQGSMIKATNPPEPGSLVEIVNEEPGNPGTYRITGACSTAINRQKDEPGNSKLMEWLQRGGRMDTGKQQPAPFKQTVDKGAVVRELQEKGAWMFNKTKGLPVNLAFSTLAGQIIPQTKNIDTAIKENIGIPSASMLSQLPGSVASLSKILSNLTNKQKKAATAGMPEDILMAFESLSDLIVTGDVGTGFLSSGRVHEETYIENLIELLKQVKTLDDLISVFDRIRFDTTLHGLDKLQAVEFRSNTAYGEIVMSLDYLGNLVLDANSQNLLATAASTLTSSMGSSQGGDPGKTLFGDGAKQMQEAFTRLAGKGEEFRNKLVRDVVDKTKQAKHDAVHKYTTGDGPPLSLFMSGLGG